MDVVAVELFGKVHTAYRGGGDECDAFEGERCIAEGFGCSKYAEK